MHGKDHIRNLSLSKEYIVNRGLLIPLYSLMKGDKIMSIKMTKEMRIKKCLKTAQTKKFVEKDSKLFCPPSWMNSFYEREALIHRDEWLVTALSGKRV